MKKILGVTAVFFVALLLAYGAGTTVNGTRTVNGNLTVKGTCTGCGGGLVLVEQHAASTSASLDFTTCLTSTYDDYKVDLLNLVPATNATTLQMLASTNGGSSYDSGNNYGWLRWGFQAGGGSASGGDSVAFMQIGLSTISSTASNSGISGTLQWFNPLNASGQKNWAGLVTLMNQGASGARTTETVSGWYNSNTAVNAFQFKMASGNITSGTIRCYGIAKS